MGYIGFLISIVSFVFMFVALIPFLGWLNWFLAPFALIGLITSLVGALNNNGKTLGIAGTVICAVVLVVSALRLIIGRGLI